ncbi:MAG: DNA gyrase subunit A [Candidatus Helarchaeota archaeon]
MTSTENIKVKSISEEMKEAYLDYAMSVIIGRALPDVRDGLKPVHRRILYAMHEIGMTSFKKSARIVGAVLGQYHPHGDAAIYDSVVRMTQEFSLRYPLIDGQGNFGSIDGDSAAAMRYTEARLAKIAKELLEDINKDTVEMVPNFDDSLKEPVVLPAKLPNLLINGASGIAVGMATNIPPHNLTEVINGIIATIKNPEITNNELMEYIKGPDFPTGGIIKGIKGIREAYNEGKGKIILQAKYEFEEFKTNRIRIIITEIPYMVNKSKLIEKIADLVLNKKIDGITDIRDESDRKGMRIVIELRSGINPDIIINNLYIHTPLRTTFGINNLVLVPSTDKKLVPRTLQLKELIEEYIKHREEVITRRTEFDKNKAEKRIHILKGLIVAINNIDDVVRILKDSKSIEKAKEKLRLLEDEDHVKISEKQVEAILRMQLQQLVKLERDKIDNELKELSGKVKEFDIILKDRKRLHDEIIKELKDLNEKYGDKRRTVIEPGELFIENRAELIPEENVVFLLTQEGYVKSIAIESYRSQKRGGKGMTAMKIGEEDEISEIFACSNHDKMCFFTNKGKVYTINVFDIPTTKKRLTRGTIINKLLQLDPDEKINAVLPVKLEDFDKNYFLTIVTKQGIIKKTEIQNLKNVRRSGIIIITLKENDDLIDVKMTNGNNDIIIGTKNGFAIRFNESEVRSTGRTSQGVIGIDLRSNDEVVEMAIVKDSSSLLTITSKGYGKRTEFKKYSRIHRGGKGVLNIQIHSKDEKVVSIKSVKDNDEIMLMTYNGNIIRIPVSDIRIIGRRTHGVTLIRFSKDNKDDRVVAVARIDESLIPQEVEEIAEDIDFSDFFEDGDE